MHSDDHLGMPPLEHTENTWFCHYRRPDLFLVTLVRLKVCYDVVASLVRHDIHRIYAPL